MRFSDIPVTPTSILSTAVIAAALGTMTMLWPAAQAHPVLAQMPVMVEEMTITAAADDAETSPVSVSLQPTRSAYLAGETITLEARLVNEGDQPVTVSAAGIYDLAVQRVASPEPMGAGDVTFMALAQAGGVDAVTLQPGEAQSRILRVGADEPFDRPGLYRVSGAWLGSDRPAEMPAFEVLIQSDEAVARKDGASTRSGA